jgi:uncharacterized repeat protein (TIGR01451 family)
MKSGVTVQGTRGSLLTPDDPSDDSIIDGAETGRPILFDLGVHNATLAGFTITNGRGEHVGGNIACWGEANTIIGNLIINAQTTGTGGYGGGIYLGSSANHSRVIDNVIENNWAWARGGAVATEADGTTIEGNVIYNNQSDWAGGIYINGSSAVIRKNLIDDNYADFRDGGGIYITSSASFTVIENNTLVNNIAIPWGLGGAIYIETVDEITIRNNIITDNQDAYGTGGIHFVSCPMTVTLTYNDVYNNGGNNYFGCTPGEGSISEDPLFVDPGNRNYHLQSGSPAIDAGDPNPAYNDPEDPANPGYALYPAIGTVRNDMGVYGGKSQSQADLTITKTASLDPVKVGSILTYTVRITNTGPYTATALIVTDTLPAGVTFLDADGSGWSCNQISGMITCTRPSLGVTPAPDITIIVTAPTSAGVITNTATVNSAVADPTGPNKAIVTTTVTSVTSTLQFSSGSYRVSENTSPAIITVTLSTISNLTATVNYATSDYTATAGKDYVATTGILTFAPGKTTQTFGVIISDDLVIEGTEAISLTLSTPVNAALSGAKSVTLTLADDDRIFLPMILSNKN